MSGLIAGHFIHDGLSFRTFVGGSGEPIVFLHGGGSRASSFHAVMERLSGAFRVLAFDMRGFGDTGADVERPITHQIWADDVGAFLDHFGIDRTFIVGWSLGTAVALNFTSQHPGRVRALTLIGAPHPDRRVNPASFERRLKIIAAGGTTADVVAATFHTIAEAFSPWTLAHRPQALEQIRQEHLAHEVRLAAKVVDGYASRSELSALLPRVTCPVTLLVGSDDHTTNLAGAEELQRQLADATLQIVPHCGHYYPVEQPDTIAALIAEAAAPANVGKLAGQCLNPANPV